MVFNSFEFALFFPLVTLLYFLLPQRFRWFHLLMASCFFYMAFVPAYILILFFTIIIDYFAGILIENVQSTRKKSFLILSIIANVGVLAVFKYYNFFIENINTLFQSINIQYHPLPYLSILLPIGLSFHTFQAMSYTIEVYRGNQKAERHFGIYALYVMFYPQLVAGPIERPQNIIHQFYEKHYFKWNEFLLGSRQIIFGLFKKMVIADRLSIYVDQVYSHQANYSGFPLIIATIFFAYQIYCDFSGYSDIALGTARIMGFNLMENFDRPYGSSSIKEFWSRWHISLSTWFRDYLYIPLGGNRRGIKRNFFNLMVTFLISGLWHGANWTYIVWGGLHGLYLIIENTFNKVVKLRLPKSTFIVLIKKLFVFFLVCVGWVFFRANNISDALSILKNSIHVSPKNLGINLSYHFMAKDFFLAIALILLLEYIHYNQKNLFFKEYVSRLSLFKNIILFNSLLLLILLFGIFQKSQFIYFQF
jgi:alginate O-acetyltransferase complex protein AlgI